MTLNLIINVKTDVISQLFFLRSAGGFTHTTWGNLYFHLPVVNITFISLLFGARELYVFGVHLI